MIKKLLRVPIIWAIILGLIANVASLGDDFFVIDSLTALGSITGTAVVIALGILFEPKYNDIADSILLIGSRYILGLAIFFIVLLSFELQTEEKAILLMLCTTPIPFNSAVYSSIFDLDTEFAIRSISLSIPFAIVSTSIIALVFGA